MKGPIAAIPPGRLSNRPGWRVIGSIAALSVAMLLFQASSCEPESPEPAGLWNQARSSDRPPGSDEEFEELRSKLGALPYLQGYHAAPERSGVTICKKDKTQPGVNLVVSGHGPEAQLMNMDGEVLHQWRFSFERAWPKGLKSWGDEAFKQYWRRARFWKNGDLAAIFAQYGLVKIDKDSNLIWKNSCKPHHDLRANDDGSVWTLTNKARKSHPQLKMTGPYLEDFITLIDADGKIVKQVSILDSFLNSAHAPCLDGAWKHGDVTHTNTIRIIGESEAAGPPFIKGRALVSIPTINLIAVIDMERPEVVWTMFGMWRYQHDPALLKNGNILIFDNKGQHGRTRVIEFDPRTQKIVWAFRDSPEHGLVSRTLGAVQRLPNGNTLIVESNHGRAIEVTAQGEIVWEFINPRRAGENNQLIATLLDVVRVPEQNSPCKAGKCFQ